MHTESSFASALYHTYTHTNCILTCWHARTMSAVGKESSCEEPCKLLVITAVSQNLVEEREGKKHGGTKREGNQ